LSRTALIVEDDSINATFLSRIIEMRGFAVDCASNGAEALQLYLKNPSYDLLLLDIMMPEVDGFAVVTVLESLFLRGKLPQNPNVIVLTAVGEFDELQEIAGFASVFSIIRKPIDVGLLDSAIQAVMSKRAG
jgi:two-component system, chemotaxis family, sensor kinase CheA